MGLYRVYIGIMEKGSRVWGHRVFYRDNGKENGNYYLGFREVVKEGIT